MGAYRDAINADDPYMHYEFNNDWTDTEGVGPTATSNYGGSTHATFTTPSFVKNDAGYHANFEPNVNSGRYLASGANAVFAGNLDNNDALSIEIWFKPHTLRTTGGQVNNLVRHDGSLWWLRIVNRYVSFVITTDVTAGAGLTDTSTQLSNGSIYHIVGTWDGDKQRIYINGSLAATSASVSGVLSFTSDTSTYVGAPGTETMDGSVDELAFYRSTLTASQILTHYRKGVGMIVVEAAVTDIDVNGKNVTVTASTDKTINALVSDTDITAGTNNLIINASITTDVTNINIDAQDAIVNAGSDVLINAVVSNINIISGNNDYIIEPLIAPGSTNIGIEAHSVIIQSDTSRTIESESPEITIDAKDVTVSTDSLIVVTKSNITVAGIGVDNLYKTLVKSKNPIHWWTLDGTLSVTPTDVSDSGSSPVIATSSGYPIAPAYTGNSSSGLSEGTNLVFSGQALSTSSIAASRAHRYLKFQTTQPFLKGENLTYELWVKTGSENVILLGVDKSNSTTDLERGRFIGIRNGHLAVGNVNRPSSFVSNLILRDGYNWSTTTATKNIRDFAWHHIVLTKSTTAGVATYKSYVDGQETNIPISIDYLYEEAGSDERHSIGNIRTNSHVNSSLQAANAELVAYVMSYSVSVDEVAMYDFAFTSQQILDHYGAGKGSTPVTVNATVSNINIDAKDTATATVINTETTNINIRSGSVQFTDGVGVTIISNQNNTQISHPVPSFSSNQTKTIYQVSGEIDVTAREARVRTAFLNFKFIPSTDTALSAEGAETLEELDFLGLLFNQSKKLLFRIGNTDTIKATFEISVESKNQEVLDAVTLSYDNITYSNSLTIPNIDPNSITECIYVKFDSNAIDLLGAGTFLINVEKS